MRSSPQRWLDALTFPLRALWLHERDRLGLSSLASERFDMVAAEVCGRVLDIGCGRWNRFVREFCNGNGVGIDVHKYEGLSGEQVLPDLSKLPFPDMSFDTVTFIANLNHVPEPLRDIELAEAFRVLVPNGRIVVTMGNPLAEILVHQVVKISDRLLGTHLDMDSERGMRSDEAYYLTNREIRIRLVRAGFTDLRIRYFWTQWALNHLFVGLKPGEPGKSPCGLPSIRQKHGDMGTY